MKICIIEDNLGDIEILKVYLKNSVLKIDEILEFRKLHPFLSSSSTNEIDLVLYDLSLPDAEGRSGFIKLYSNIEVPVVVVTGSNDTELAVNLVSLGAQDYIIKGSLSPQLLSRVVRYSIERYSILQELDQSLLNYHSILETAPISIIKTDNNGNILEFNRESVEVLKLDRKNLHSYNILDIIEDTESNSIKSYLDTTKKKDLSKVDIVMPNQRDELLRLRINASSQENIPSSGIIWTIEDITSEYLMHEKLIENEEKFRSLFENSPFGVIVLNTDGKMINVNTKISSMLGYTKENLIGRNIIEITPNEDIKKTKLLFQKVLESKDDIYTIEKRYITQSSEHIWVEITIYKHTIGGNNFVVDIVRDISNSKKLERQMKQNKAEIERSRKFETFGLLAGGIVHDFNNTLTLISGYTDLSKMHIDNPTLLTDYLTQISNGVKSAIALVNSLLVFSKTKDEDTEVINLNEFIENLNPILKRTIGSNIEITYQLSEKDPVILGSKEQLTQVLINLAINARDAIDQIGSINIQTDIVPTSDMIKSNKVNEVSLDERFCVLKISDDGTGMTEEQLDQIYDPFYTTKPEGQGTGLGLTNVKRVIDNHDGFIYVESAKGIGTTFTMLFPELTDNQQKITEKRTEEASEKYSLKPYSILLVEDNDKVKSMLKKQLESYNANVITGKNGQEGLEKLLENKIDLLLTDIQMPKMSGIQLLKLAKKYKPDLPIILMSANFEHKTHYLQGFDHIPQLTKPFEFSQLIKIIHKELISN